MFPRYNLVLTILKKIAKAVHISRTCSPTYRLHAAQPFLRRQHVLS